MSCKLYPAPSFVCIVHGVANHISSIFIYLIFPSLHSSDLSLLPHSDDLWCFSRCSHKAMLSYLHSAGMHDAYDALKAETDNAEFDPSDVKAKWVGLLEKKWTSVIRLQKKVSPLFPALSTLYQPLDADALDHGSRIPKRIVVIRTINLITLSRIFIIRPIPPPSSGTAHPHITSCANNAYRVPSHMDSVG